MTSTTAAQAMATQLRADLAGVEIRISLDRALELVAHQLGHRDWNDCTAALTAQPQPTLATIPILRTFPGPEAGKFYVEYLGFTVDWEYRFEDGLPLYQQVSRGPCVLHLSEHHGDATPGSAIRIAVTDLPDLRQQLLATPYPLHSGISDGPWGQDMTIPDPFGNKINFHQPRQSTERSLVRRG